MSKAKSIGTAAETAVVRYLQSLGYQDVHRVVLHGKNDEGDIQIGSSDNPDIIIEVKSRKQECTYSEVAGFMKELEAEQLNKWHKCYTNPLASTEAKKAFLVIKRPGKGKVQDWWLCWNQLINKNKTVICRCRVGDYFEEVK